jgi:peptidoglycan/xylan/chitin deacetylase (PgdA/CDA1 family)
MSTTPLSRRRLLQLAALTAAGATPLLAGLPDAAAAPSAPSVPSVDISKKLLHRLPGDHFIAHGPGTRRNVAITIDDWWWTDDTLRYLDDTLNIARSFGAGLTFFPVGGALRAALGAQPKATKRLWRRAVEAGHVIGNHTQTHEPMSTMSAQAITWNLKEQHRWVEKVLGTTYHEHLMRPPGGDGGFPSQGRLFDHTLGVVRDLDYYLTMWSIDSNAPDGSIVTANEDARFLTKIFDAVRPGSIVLVHPTTLSTTGLETLVRELNRRDYDLVTVPDLYARDDTWTEIPI